MNRIFKSFKDKDGLSLKKPGVSAKTWIVGHKTWIISKIPGLLAKKWTIRKNLDNQANLDYS